MKFRLVENFLFRYFFHVLVLIIILILAGGYFIFIKPSLILLRPGHALDVNSYEDILQKEEAHLIKLENLEQEYNTLDQDKLTKLGYLIGEKFDEPSLLYLIEAINQHTGVVPEQFSYASEKGITNIKLRFSGKDYNSFKNYLKVLEESIRLMDVNNLQISVIDGNYTLEILTYYLE